MKTEIIIILLITIMITIIIIIIIRNISINLGPIQIVLRALQISTYVSSVNKLQKKKKDKINK